MHARVSVWTCDKKGEYGESPQQRWELNCLRRAPLLWTVFISIPERRLEMCLYSAQNDHRKIHKTFIDWIGYVLLLMKSTEFRSIFGFGRLSKLLNEIFFRSHWRWKFEVQNVYSETKMEYCIDRLCSSYSFGDLYGGLVLYREAHNKYRWDYSANLKGMNALFIVWKYSEVKNRDFEFKAGITSRNRNLTG